MIQKETNRQWHKYSAALAVIFLFFIIFIFIFFVGFFYKQTDMNESFLSINEINNYIIEPENYVIDGSNDLIKKPIIENIEETTSAIDAVILNDNSNVPTNDAQEPKTTIQETMPTEKTTIQVSKTTTSETIVSEETTIEPILQETPTEITTTLFSVFPKVWEQGDNKIEIYKETYADCVVYAAHLTFSDYKRFGTYCSNNSYGSYCTTSEAAEQLGAILCVNGDYNPPSIGYSCARNGVVYKDGKCYAVGIYNNHNGVLFQGDEGTKTGGQQLSSLVANGIATDTIQFGPALVIDGQLRCQNSGNKRPRTVIGTNGQPGDIWIMVSNGDNNDGTSVGLTSYESGAYLFSKGCSLVIPLDGGGSSTMVFQGEVLTGTDNGQRPVTDFVYFK